MLIIDKLLNKTITPYRHALKVLCIFILFVSFSSCVSKQNFFIPGEYETYIQNIGIEYYTIAEEYSKLKNYKEAVIFYQKCLNYNVKTENELRYKIALNSAKDKDWENAIINYEFLQNQDTQNKTIKESLAYIYAKDGNKEKASELYKQLYEDNPFDSENAENYIYILIATNDIENAHILFDKYKIDFPDSENIEKINELLNPTITE